MILRAESDAARAAVFCLSQIQQYNVQVSELEPGGPRATVHG